MEEWREIMLCLIIDSDETPLFIIGSNDQAAYAMTPSPHLRMILVGDLKTQPHFKELTC